MKIKFTFNLSEDDLETLEEQFFEFSWWIFDEEWADDVIVDTNNIEVEFLEFYKPWVDQWYSIVYNKDEDIYEIISVTNL